MAERDTLTQEERNALGLDKVEPKEQGAVEATPVERINKSGLSREKIDLALAQPYTNDDEATSTIKMHISEQLNVHHSTLDTNEAIKDYFGVEDGFKTQELYEILNKRSQLKTEPDDYSRFINQGDEDKVAEALKNTFEEGPDGKPVGQAQGEGSKRKLVELYEAKLRNGSKGQWLKYIDKELENQPTPSRMRKFATRTLMAGEVNMVEYNSLSTKDKAFFADYLMLSNPERAVTILENVGLSVKIGAGAIGESLGKTADFHTLPSGFDSFDQKYIYSTLSSLDPNWQDRFDSSGKIKTIKDRQEMVMLLGEHRFESWMKLQGSRELIGDDPGKGELSNLFRAKRSEFIEDTRKDIDNIYSALKAGEAIVEQDKEAYKIRQAVRKRYNRGEGATGVFNNRVAAVIPMAMDLGAVVMLSRVNPALGSVYSAARLQGELAEQMEYEYGFSRDESVRWAGIVAVPYAAVEVVQGRQFEKSAMMNFRALYSKAYRNALGKTAGKVFLELGKKHTTSTIMEIGEEGVQKLIEQSAIRAAEEIEKTGNVDERQLIKDFGNEILEAAKSMPFLTGGAAGIGTTAAIATDFSKTRSLRGMLDKWSMDVVESKLKEDIQESAMSIKDELALVDASDMELYRNAETQEERIAILDNANVSDPAGADAILRNDTESLIEYIDGRARILKEAGTDGATIDAVSRDLKERIEEDAKAFESALRERRSSGVKQESVGAVQARLEGIEEIKAGAIEWASSIGIDSTEFVEKLSQAKDPREVAQLFENTIEVVDALASDAGVLVRHEGFHAMLENYNLLTKAEGKVLNSAVNKLATRVALKRAGLDISIYDDMTNEGRAKEIMAEAGAILAPQELDVFQRASEFFMRLYNFVRGRGFQSVRDVLKNVEKRAQENVKAGQAQEQAGEARFARRVDNAEFRRITGLVKKEINSARWEIDNADRSTKQGRLELRQEIRRKENAAEYYISRIDYAMSDGELEYLGELMNELIGLTPSSTEMPEHPDDTKDLDAIVSSLLDQALANDLLYNGKNNPLYKFWKVVSGLSGSPQIELINRVEVAQIEGFKDGGAFSVAGTYWHDRHKIEIPVSVYRATEPDSNLITITHEYIHALSSRELESNKAYRAEMESLLAQAKSSLTAAQNAEFEYALINVDEFVAGAWTDDSFMTALAGIYSEESGQSVLDKFLDLIKTILADLGVEDVNTLLADVLAASSRGFRVGDKTFIELNPGQPRFARRATLPATIDIDGHQLSTTNSEGQQIADTEEQVRNFWNWFGDSKMIDEKGRPLVVYHGTPDGDFTVFDTEGKQFGLDEEGELKLNVSGPDPTAFIGSHFALGDDARKVAKDFATGMYNGRFSDGKSDVKMVYLKIDNPLKMNAQDFALFTLYNAAAFDPQFNEEFWEDNHEDYDLPPEFVIEEMIPDNMIDENRFTDRMAEMYTAYMNSSFELEEDAGIANAREAGAGVRDMFKLEYGADGVIYENEIEGGTAVIVFEPTQIKSATDNVGTFDPTNPDIRFARRAESAQASNELANDIAEFLAQRILDGNEVSMADIRALAGASEDVVQSIVKQTELIVDKMRKIEAGEVDPEQADMTISDVADDVALAVFKQSAKDEGYRAGFEAGVTKERAVASKRKTERTKAHRFGSKPTGLAFKDLRTKTPYKKYSEVRTEEQRAIIMALVEKDAKANGVKSKQAINDAYNHTLAAILWNDVSKLKYDRARQTIQRKLDKLRSSGTRTATANAIIEDVYKRLDVISEIGARGDIAKQFERIWRKRGNKRIKYSEYKIDAEITDGMSSELQLAKNAFELADDVVTDLLSKVETMLEAGLSADDTRVIAVVNELTGKLPYLKSMGSLDGMQKLKLGSDMLVKYGALGSADADVQAEALAVMLDEIEVGARNAVDAALDLTIDITGGIKAGLLATRSDSGKKVKSKNKMWGWLFNIEQRFEALGKFSKHSDKIASLRDRLAIQESSDEFDTTMNTWARQVGEMFKNVYNVKDLERLVHKLNEPLMEFAKFNLVDGTALSRAQLMQIIGTWEQQGARGNVKAAGKKRSYEQRDIDAMKEALDPKDLEFIEQVRAFYQMMGQELDAKATDVLGRTVSNSDPNYMPVVVDVLKLWNASEIHASPLLDPGLRQRKSHNTPIDITASITGVLDSKIRQNAHWKSFVRSHAIASSVFADHALAKQLDTIHSTNWDLTKEHLTSIYADKRTGALQVPWLRKVANLYTMSALSYNTKLPFTQFTSFPAFAYKYGVVNFTRMLASNPIGSEAYVEAFKVLWNSDQMKNRLRSGTDEFVESAMRREFGESVFDKIPEGKARDIASYMGTMLKRFAKAGMWTTRAGDVAPIMVFGPAIYLEELRNADGNQERALSRTWQAIHSTQQSYATKDRNYLSRNGGSIGMMFNMFVTTPGQYLAYEVLAIQKLAASNTPENRREVYNALFISHIALPVLFYTVGTIFSNAIGGDDEDALLPWNWSDDDKLGLATAMLIGPNQAWPVFGAISEAGIESVLSGEAKWGRNNILPVSGVIRDAQLMGTVLFNARNMQWSEALEDFMKLATESTSAGRQAKKVGTKIKEL